jgi:hypothetical protein
MLVAITGFIPWILDITGGSEFIRKSFIEIHDKIALLLFLLLTIHSTNRFKWYRATHKRLTNKHNKQHRC